MNSNELQMLRAEVLNRSIDIPIKTINVHPTCALHIFPTDLIEMIDATISMRQLDAMIKEANLLPPL